MELIRPTGIIRTLPSLEYGFNGDIGRKRYKSSIKELQRGLIDAIYIALAQRRRCMNNKNGEVPCPPCYTTRNSILTQSKNFSYELRRIT